MAQQLPRDRLNNSKYSALLRHNAPSQDSFDVALYPPIPQEQFDVGMLFTYTPDDMIKTEVRSETFYVIVANLISSEASLHMIRLSPYAPYRSLQTQFVDLANCVQISTPSI